MEETGNLNHKHTHNTRITLVLAEVSVFVALATVLSLIIVYNLPQGGAITAGSMIPIIWLALRRGWKIGIVTGMLYGIIQLLILPYAYNPWQTLLDYPLAFGCLGLAGFFRKWPIAGAVVGITGRFIMHFLSGAFYFAAIYAPGIDPYLYSAVYNGSYLIPEMVISAFIMYVLQKSKVLNVYI